MLLLSIAGCGSDDGSTEAASSTNDLDAAVDDAACELLSSESRLPAPPPATATNLMSLLAVISGLFSGSLEGETAQVQIFVEPESASSLEEVADAAADVPGADVTSTMDQEAAHAEVLELLGPDNPSVANIEPGDLPPSVSLTVESTSAIEDLRAAFADDPRVREVVDDRLTPSGAGVRAKLIAVGFEEELRQLSEADIAGASVGTSILSLADAGEDATLDEVRSAKAEMEALVEAANGGCGLEVPGAS
ncbi:hypothetical protein [Actinospongicola halichondriae]|uniref:hypothetical protein n=1 Tax=Actinospongicola halichondriae TaxID=3236844 RepID=UPI003D4CFA3D